MTFSKSHIFLLVLLTLSLSLPQDASAISLDLPTLSGVTHNLTQIKDSITASLPALPSLPPPSPKKVAGAATTNAAVVGSWVDNLRARLNETLNSFPRPTIEPPTPPVAPAPVSPQAQPQVQLQRGTSPSPNPPAVFNALTPTTPSLVTRLAGLENQVSSLRNLIGRQSDSNVSHVESIVTETIAISAPSFDTGASHDFSALQIFANASSTLFSSQYASTTILCVSGDCRTSWPGGSAGAGFPFLTLGSGENSTSTTLVFQNGFISNASSTLASTTVTRFLSTNATTTDLYVGNIASATELRSNTGIIGFLTSVFGSFINILATGSSTFQSFTASQGTTTSATSTNLYTTDFLSIGSTTLQKFFASRGTTTSATSTNLYTTDFLAIGSTTLQNFFASRGTTTSATSTNLYTTDFLAIGSTTLRNFFASQGTTTSATSTNLYTTNFLAFGSTTLQNFFASQGTTTSATSTNLYTTNFLSIGSTTFQRFFAWQGTTTSATSTNLYTNNFLALSSTTLQSATSTNFYASSALNIGPAMNFLGRATTTVTVNDTAWVIATTTAAASYPLLSFNNAYTNNAGTSTIQFFGATTTGLVAGSGIALPANVNQMVIIGDGKTQSGLSILKGGLCVDNDGWCTASTTGRISSVSSYLGGADLAEMYQAGEHLEAGDVVSILSGITVSKAVPDGRDHMMGVVSTNPGVVLGSGPDRQGRVGDVPIALAGRVPVRVSTENGAIHAGDYLTLSGTAGVAAKALRAGTAIGQALEDYSGSGVGSILVFVKNSYYSGLSLDNFAGLTSQGSSQAEAILVALQSGAHTTSSISSDLTADRMLAAVEIITPKITTGLLSAQTIESPTITALSNRITTEISTLQSQINAQDSALTSLNERVTALENASSTSFSLAAVSDAVNTFMTSTTNWIVDKIEAQFIKAVNAVFTKLCLSDDSGETCITRSDLNNLLNNSGQSGASAPVLDPVPEPEITPDPEVHPEPEASPEDGPTSEPEAQPAPEPGA
jgi:hypothetical protein